MSWSLPSPLSGLWTTSLCQSQAHCRDEHTEAGFSLPPCEEGRVRGWSGAGVGESPYP